MDPDRDTQTTPSAAARLSADELAGIDAYWRAANYLSVGQIYLLDNPLLREPLRPEHIKPRLLGHWGTTPGLNFIYAHLNRVIRNWDLDAIYVCGPGHGGPAMVANAYLEGTYSEVYPSIARDAEGMQRLFRQFSFPGGIPSHVAPETPGSIHEGGELGYSLAHAYGAAFDNPDLLVACVVGDGEAETGPLATSWHSNKFLDPARDGAVLPILHLNGYKIANPTVLARIADDELEQLLRGLRLPRPISSRATNPSRCTSAWPRPWTRSSRRSAPSSAAPATTGEASRPALADDRAAHAQGLDRAQGRRRPAGRGHVPLPPGAARRGAHQPGAPRAARRRGCAATAPRSCSTRTARSTPSCAALAPEGAPAHERQPARQRRPAAARPRLCPTSATTRSTCRAPARRSCEATKVARRLPARRDRRRTRRSFRLFGPDETASNRLQCGLRGHRPRLRGADPGHRRPPRARRPRDRGPLRAPVPGLARGLPADRPPRPVQLLRGVHPHHRLDVQPARQVAEGQPRASPGGSRSPRSTTCSARTSGGRTTTASRTRTRASSTTSSTRRPRSSASTCRRTPTACCRCRPLPAQPRLRQRDRRRQAARSRNWLSMDEAIAALHARHRHLGVGLQRRRRRARRRAGLLRRRPDARDAGRGRHPARAPARAEGARGQRRRPDAAAARRRSTRTACPTPSSTRCSRPTGR